MNNVHLIYERKSGVLAAIISGCGPQFSRKELIIHNWLRNSGQTPEERKKLVDTYREYYIEVREVIEWGSLEQFA